MRRIQFIITAIFAIAAIIPMMASRLKVSGESDGRAVYVAKCYACHGIDGSGNNTVGRSLKLGDIRPAIRRMSDEELRTVITDGRRRMEPIKKINEQEILGLTLFLHDLADGKPDIGRSRAEENAQLLPRVRDTYRDKCSACHAQDGTGRTTIGRSLTTPDLTSPAVQNQSMEQLAESITKGRGKMPGYARTFNSAQVDQLVNYILTIKERRSDDPISTEVSVPVRRRQTEEQRSSVPEPRPVRTVEQSSKTGHQLYIAKCSACHSPDGSSSGTLGRALHVPSLRSSQIQSLTYEILADVIRNGIQRVRHTKISDPEQIRLLVTYIRELGR